MNKFYLNHYKWLDHVLVILFTTAGFFFIEYCETFGSKELIPKLTNASDSLFGAIASLLGFVFAIITILVGLGDNYKNNDNSKNLIDIIKSLSEKDDTEINSNKFTASGVFFSTEAYPVTLKCLMGIVRILTYSFILCLIVKIFGNENSYWAALVIVYLTYAVLAIIRLLITIKLLIKILTNNEEANQ